MSENIKNGELTFQQVFALLKKSLVRIIVYVLISAILVGAAGLIIIFSLKGDEQYRAMIQFNYDGADEGLDPWGGTLDVNKIKSNEIIADAVKLDFGGDAEKEAKMLEEIKNNLSVAGVVPEDAMEQILIIKQIATSSPNALKDLSNMSYYSTSFVITLTNTDDMKLSSEDCVRILNGIVDNYIAYFKESYGFKNALGTTVAEKVEYEHYDYIELTDVFETQLDATIEYLDSRIKKSPDFRSIKSKMTFADMKARIDAIRDYDLETLNAYVLDNGVARDNMPISAQTYIANRIKALNREIEITNSYITSTDAALAAWQPLYNTTTSPEGTTQQVLANGDVQVALYDDLTKYKSELVKLKGQLALWQERQTTFNAVASFTPEEKQVIWDKADLIVSGIYDKISSEIDTINDAVDEYIETEVMKDAIKKTVSATPEKTDLSGIKTLLLIEVVVVVLACIIAVGVTNKKSKSVDLRPETVAPTAKSEEGERPLRKRYLNK